MKNSDKSAYPVDKKTNDEIEDGFWHINGYGLTKREYAAIKAMQGLWSSDNEFEMTAESVAQLAVESADELLKQLEETQ